MVATTIGKIILLILCQSWRASISSNVVMIFLWLHELFFTTQLSLVLPLQLCCHYFFHISVFQILLHPLFLFLFYSRLDISNLLWTLAQRITPQEGCGGFRLPTLHAQEISDSLDHQGKFSNAWKDLCVLTFKLSTPKKSFFIVIVFIPIWDQI